jgi:LemA protein
MAEEQIKSMFQEYKWVIPFVVLIIVVMMIIVPFIGSYNAIVAKDVKVERARGNVQTALERRADLIPNLVSTIEGSAVFEYSTLVDVTAARASATQIKAQIESAQTPEQLQAAQDSLAGVIGRLLLVYEQYPTLQTTVAFRELQAQLTATENQINSERNNYNTAVTDYKTTVRVFPSNIVAKIFGYKENKWSMFSASPGKTEVPAVDFNFKFAEK